ATYNTSSGTTALTFRSIDNQPASDRAALQTLSQDLFGTLSGHPSWITAGTTGAGAVAIGSQYYQHYPATLYDGVFYFLLAIGAFLVLLALFFHQKVETWFKRQTKDPKNLVVGLMGLTMLLGGFFMPFYPWPYVIFFAAAVILLAWKFPQLSLMVMVLLVVPEVAYQSGALGFIFLFAMIPVLFASLLDWRFGVGA